jgi:tetratricopeptide (TPR) repeat protein
VLVVPDISGDPKLPNCDCHRIGADHISLVKPDSRKHDVYLGVRRFIEKALDSGRSSVVSKKLPEAADRPPTVSQNIPTRSNERFDISRIAKFAPTELIGRDDEMSRLNDAWSSHDRQNVGFADRVNASENSAHALASVATRVLTFVALGGEGKTALVAKWAADLAAQNWPGCEAAFAWSFYSQGSREQMAASSDLFLKTALDFFGDDEDKQFAAGPAGPFEKGQRLARVVSRRRTLLILDGVEPLQFAPISPTPGQLKDQGLAALLTGLATNSQGLCVVTTRYSLPDLQAFRQTTAPEVPLPQLSRAAGVDLLKPLGVKGSERPVGWVNQRATHHDEPSTVDSPNPTLNAEDGGSRDARPTLRAELRAEQEPLNEFEQLVEDVHGHALTLTLLGSYLRDAHGGDIRRRDLVKFSEADDEEQGGHAFRVLDAYVQWFQTGGRTAADNEKGQRAVSWLRLLGLFDRPASADCLAALLQPPPLPGLTEPLLNLPAAQLNVTLSRLESAKLITLNRDPSLHTSNFTLPTSIDAHPHLREYFARQMRAQNPAGFQAAHRRLYEHLCATTKDQPEPTLDDLQPLYQAVAHGCLAGLQQEACEQVYFVRITRRDDKFPTRKLGAFGTDLGAVSCFFEEAWKRASPTLTPEYQAWILNQAAFRLRALGRLTEALEPMRAGLEMRIQQQVWKNAAIVANNLSELSLTLGEVSAAVGDAERSVTYADRSGDAFERLSDRTTHADALHQAGRRAEALARFREAEQMQAARQPVYPLLYGPSGFQYCELLLASSERAAWSVGFRSAKAGSFRGTKGDTAECLAVAQRSAQTLRWVTTQNWLLDIALDHLTLGRAKLYESLLSAEPSASERSNLKSQISEAASELDQAVSGLRRAGTMHWIPTALVTRSWQRYLTGFRVGPDSAQSDLDEAWEIASRGPMRLFLADILLTRARLFGSDALDVRRTSSPSSQTSDGGDGLEVRRTEQFSIAYPWESPAADLAAAEKLINECSYLRRKQELTDANAAILGTK